MNTQTPGGPPPVHMIDSEADAIASLAVSAGQRLAEVSALLFAEIERAIIHGRADIPPDAIIMNARVEYIDGATGAARTVELVYPGEADIAKGRISILTPVGAGLIGLRRGESILWPDRGGHERKLRLVRVTPRR